MLKRIIDAWLVELKLLLRNIYFWILIIVSIPFFAIQYNRLLPLNPGDALTSTAFIIQAGIFMNMILGFHIMKQEVVSYSDEIFNTLPRGYFVKSIGKILTLVTLTIGFVLLALIILYIVYSFHPIPKIFYLKAIPYLFLYFGISFLISGLIGLGIGIYTNSKIAYIFFVFIWILLGPLNIATLEPIMTIIKRDLSGILIFLNLGQTDPNEPYDPVYGLPIETQRWIIKGIMLIIVLTVVLLMLLKKSYVGNFKTKLSITIASLLILAPLIYSYMQTNQIVTILHGQDSILRYDYSYYKQNPDVYFKNSNKLILNSYNIQLKKSRALSAKAIMELTTTTDSKEFIFSLYHRLKVKSAKLNGKMVNIKQKGDQINITSTELIKKNEKIKIEIEYNGLSSPFYFANEQSIMLPSYFIWYPIPGSHQAMKVKDGELKHIPMELNNDVQFDLKYDGNLDLKTNIPYKGNGRWSGYTKDGLTVVGGLMEIKKVNDKEIVFPTSMTFLHKEIPSYLKELHEITNEINKDLNVKLDSDKHNIFFISTPKWSERTPSNLLILNNQIFVGITQDYNGADLLTDKSILIPSVLQSILSNKDLLEQNEEVKYFFVSSYSYWYNMRTPIFKGEVLPLKHEIEIYKRDPKQIHEKELKILEELLKFIENNAQNTLILRSFFQDWLKELNSTQNITFNDIQNLIIKSEKRMNKNE
ncbi:hypothetical protein V7166_22295 [Bacillus thuringiensis]